MEEAGVNSTLTEQEFWKAVGISRVTAWQLRLAGKLSYCRVGNKVLYLPRHMDEFLTLCERKIREPHGGLAKATKRN
jgi:hypothetical protein